MAASGKSGSKKSFKTRYGNGLEFGIIAMLVLLFLNLLSWPVAIADESLDGSWQAILSFSLEHRLRFGEEVLFTYGPLGSLSTFSYSGYNHAGKYAFELFMRLSLVVFMFRFLPHLKPYYKIGCVFVFLLILQLLPDVYETFFFFGLLAWSAGLILERRKKGPPSWGLIALGILFIVCCSLVKFTLLVAGVFCLGVVAVHFLMLKRTAEALALVLGYPVAFFGLWLMLGQHAGDVPHFIYGSYQVAKGYALSMQLATQPEVVKFFILYLLASLAFIAVVLKDQFHGKIKWKRLKEPWAPMLIIYSALLFMVWKQAAVRSDGHIWQFFCYVPLAAWFVFPVVKKSRSQQLSGILLVLKLLLMVFALETLLSRVIPQVPERVWKNTAHGLQGLLKPSNTLNDLKARMDARGASLLEKQVLLRQVGERSVDQVGDHQGLVILPGLRYQPRPVFQNYVANNAYLQRLNAEYWRTDETPETVIQSLDAIDGTMPTQSDSQSLLYLLSHYRREATENANVLLSKRITPASVVLSTERIYRLSFGEAATLDSGPGAVLARMEVPLNLLGRMRAFLYKPPIIRMVVELDDRSTREYRLNPVTVELDFLFVPALNSAPELWDMREGRTFPGVKSVTLLADPGESWFFSRSLSMTITPIGWEGQP